MNEIEEQREEYPLARSVGETSGGWVGGGGECRLRATPELLIQAHNLFKNSSAFLFNMTTFWCSWVIWAELTHHIATNCQNYWQIIDKFTLEWWHWIGKPLIKSRILILTLTTLKDTYLLVWTFKPCTFLGVLNFWWPALTSKQLWWVELSSTNWQIWKLWKVHLL